ncbi:hypothetical protein HQ489_03510 [Candidatus Woesearchaeota archaeon]|nr:hypothetical protein [Candidatus Woesearchaeota archaeon]
MTLIQLPQRKKAGTTSLLNQRDHHVVKCTLEALGKEQTLRPQLVDVLLGYSSLLSEYLLFDDPHKEKLELFRQRHPLYLSGHGEGTGIKYLNPSAPLNSLFGVFSSPPSRQYPVLIHLAKKCRFAHQLEMVFDYYCQSNSQRKFTKSYITHDLEVSKKIKRMGYNLIQNIRHSDSSLDDIVGIVAQKHPLIHEFYHTPGTKSARIFDFDDYKKL